MPYNAINRDNAANLGLSLGAPLTGHGKSLAKLRAELLLTLLNRQDLDVPTLNGYINDAYIDMATSIENLSSIQRSVEIALVAGQPLYYLGADAFAVDEVGRQSDDPTGGEALTKIDLDGYRKRTTRTGRPTMYFYHNYVLVIYPKPENIETLVLDIRIRVQPLTDDTHCPIFDIEWHEGIKLLARAKAFSDIQEWEAAAVAENDYVKFVRRRSDDSARSSDTLEVRSSVPRNRGMMLRHQDRDRF